MKKGNLKKKEQLIQNKYRPSQQKQPIKKTETPNTVNNLEESGLRTWIILHVDTVL